MNSQAQEAAQRQQGASPSGQGKHVTSNITPGYSLLSECCQERYGRPPSHAHPAGSALSDSARSDGTVSRQVATSIYHSHFPSVSNHTASTTGLAPQYDRLRSLVTRTFAHKEMTNRAAVFDLPYCHAELDVKSQDGAVAGTL